MTILKRAKKALQQQPIATMAALLQIEKHQKVGHRNENKQQLHEYYEWQTNEITGEKTWIFLWK